MSQKPFIKPKTPHLSQSEPNRSPPKLFDEPKFTNKGVHFGILDLIKI